MYPFATASFRGRSTLLRVHPPLCRFMKAYCTLRVLRLVVFPLCRLYVLAHLRTILPIRVYSTSKGSPVPPLHLSVSPGGFIPDAANTSGNYLTNVSSIETIMCIVSFYISNNYRDLIADSLYCRLLQTHLLHRSPPPPLWGRSMQPV